MQQLLGPHTPQGGGAKAAAAARKRAAAAARTMASKRAKRQAGASDDDGISTSSDDEQEPQAQQQPETVIMLTLHGAVDRRNFRCLLGGCDVRSGLHSAAQFDLAGGQPGSATMGAPAGPCCTPMVNRISAHTPRTILMPTCRRHDLYVLSNHPFLATPGGSTSDRMNLPWVALVRWAGPRFPKGSPDSWQPVTLVPPDASNCARG